MELTRRQALGLFGAAGAVSLVELRGARAWAAACSAAPAETEGPYFVDELLDRSDIRVDPSDGSVEPGVLLRLDLTVVQADADCAPAAGVQVDVWHCSAGGIYSDEAANSSVGQKFLRGYQVTDANGVVSFTTVYPGWYSGRTIHVHWKVRTFSGDETTYEFTSQLFFDETVNDAVMSQAPYSSRGTRDTRNANDGIYDEALLLTPTSDGSGGWVGAFTIGVTDLVGGGTTSTSSCATLTDCRAELTAALPDAASAASRKALRVARRLARLDDRAGAALDRAASASGSKQARLYQHARGTIAKLVAAATAANGAGTLGVALSPITQAAAAVLALVPSV